MIAVAQNAISSRRSLRLLGLDVAVGVSVGFMGLQLFHRELVSHDNITIA